MEKAKNFILAIVIFVLGVVIAIMQLANSVTIFQQYNPIKNDNINNAATLERDKETLKNKQQEQLEAKQKEANMLKEERPFYKPVMQGLDTEAVIAGEFSEILTLIRDNKIKVRSIKYDYSPQDDNFVTKGGSEYNVARLNLEMISNYKNYDSFLKGLYKHEHFLNIESVEIVPYKKNKSVLLIVLKLKLYSKND